MIRLLAALLLPQDAYPLPPQELLTPPPSTAAVHDVVPPSAGQSGAAPVVVEDVEVEVRLLDLVDVEGHRRNQLVGTGVVVGLNGTGDGSPATRKALSNLIQRFDLNVSPIEVDADNVALVMVTAILPPFARKGRGIDVKVSSVGDAESLFGGELVQTPLYGADRQVYLVAQGPVTVGGFSASGDAASVTRNHPLVGLVESGGLVEREVPMPMLSKDGHLNLLLRHPSYLTAARIAERLDALFPGAARALDPATVRLRVDPAWRDDPVGLLAKLSEERVRPAEEAIVVVNERTGTIVAGNKVRVSTVAITHGNLTISVAESPTVSQPAPFARRGQTTVVPRSDVEAAVEQREMVVVPGGTSVSELAAALNRLGVNSRDLVLIFQALDRMGALHGRLELM